MAEYGRVKNAVTCVSGTSALHLAVQLAGVKRGDVLFCSDMTFAATVNPIENAAESLSATYKGAQTGIFGEYNAICFNENKIITTSDCRLISR